jgi:hypothetical protein
VVVGEEAFRRLCLIGDQRPISVADQGGIRLIALTSTWRATVSEAKFWPKPPLLVPLPSHPKHLLEIRAEETRILTEQVKDREAKARMLRIADDCDWSAERAAERTAKAKM